MLKSTHTMDGGLGSPCPKHTPDPQLPHSPFGPQSVVDVEVVEVDVVVVVVGACPVHLSVPLALMTHVAKSAVAHSPVDVVGFANTISARSGRSPCDTG